jgi:antitoxin (DNA-binding transcriptional repressor) of toxin-antitoxin stability system
MKATVLDLRYKMKKVLNALDRREKITILYHGKVKGTIVPAGPEKTIKVKDHSLFKIAEKESKPPAEEMDEIRGSRYDDI